jgi:hypothetical protein
MPRVGIRNRDPSVRAGKKNVHALDRAATVIGGPLYQHQIIDEYG